MAKFARGDSITPVSNDLKRNIVPSWVKDMIFAKTLPINSNPVDINGTLRIKIAKSIWTPNPLATNNQSIPFYLQLIYL